MSHKKVMTGSGVKVVDILKHFLIESSSLYSVIIFECKKVNDSPKWTKSYVIMVKIHCQSGTVFQNPLSLSKFGCFRLRFWFLVANYLLYNITFMNHACFCPSF